MNQEEPNNGTKRKYCTSDKVKRKATPAISTPSPEYGNTNDNSTLVNLTSLRQERTSRSCSETSISMSRIRNQRSPMSSQKTEALFVNGDYKTEILGPSRMYPPSMTGSGNRIW